MSKQATFPKYTILGIEVDAVTIDEATDYITAKAKDPTSAACFVVKPYVEFLTQAYQRPAIIKLLNDAELCLPDGVSLNWAAHYLYGGPRNFQRWLFGLVQILIRPKQLNDVLPDRFSGVKATWRLLEACEKENLKVFLIGSPKHQTIEGTAQAIQKRLPKLMIVGTFKGHFGTSDKEELYAKLQAAKPDVVLVGMGFPLQELLMAEVTTNHVLTHGVLVGEGGSFDYDSFGGQLKKAPSWMQKIGLEWLWRLVLEPSRIKRQLAIPRFIWLVYRKRRKSA